MSPNATPNTSSNARRGLLPSVMLRQITAATGAKKGLSWPKNTLATKKARLAAAADCATAHTLARSRAAPLSKPPRTLASKPTPSAGLTLCTPRGLCYPSGRRLCTLPERPTVRGPLPGVGGRIVGFSPVGASASGGGGGWTLPEPSSSWRRMDSGVAEMPSSSGP